MAGGNFQRPVALGARAVVAGGHVTAFAQCGRHLRQAVCTRLQVNHLHAGRKALEQGGHVLDAAVHKDDFTRGRAGGVRDAGTGNGHGLLS